MPQQQRQPQPFYYLENFLTVLGWIAQRYSALLADDELIFLGEFPLLPLVSQALLVRMVMRKGDLFRGAKLQYDEIGCPESAAQSLIAAGWIDAQPALDIAQLFGLLKKSELTALLDLPGPLKNARKAEQLLALGADLNFSGTRPLHEWLGQNHEAVYRIQPAVVALCERLRLMFFGNLHQDWSEFVLSELGIFKYEKVGLSEASQGFRTRSDVDDYLHLHRCREQFLQGDAALDVLPAIPSSAYANDWLESRRAKLLFQIAQYLERCGELAEALNIYTASSWPGARVRAIRVMERCGQNAAAFVLAESAGHTPESEAEKQQVLRILPRLHRRLGHPKLPAAPIAAIPRHKLVLPQPDTAIAVELLVRDHFTLTHAPALYVENSLINSLFGLLCWDAVFAAVPGAFFHPFQSGPADLLSPEFQRRRAREFETCLTQLDSDLYRQTILRNFRDKADTQSPFVFWGALSTELLMLALHCIPAAHLRKWCERLLQDLRANRSGYPDLIQFWPAERRYLMIEVKGPGDRLQDNQLRWLAYCAEHAMPVAVCYVQWAKTEAEAISCPPAPVFGHADTFVFAVDPH